MIKLLLLLLVTSANIREITCANTHARYSLKPGQSLWGNIKSYENGTLMLTLSMRFKKDKTLMSVTVNQDHFGRTGETRWIQRIDGTIIREELKQFNEKKELTHIGKKILEEIKIYRNQNPDFALKKIR